MLNESISQYFLCLE